nr:integrase, catalytic region, zinc finger, CCHC-type, peptidase aspartic, catalytic [Tanacetum cinerariifolium]
MFKLDLVPLPPKLLQNRDVHINYLRNTQEQANILQDIVEQAKAKQPLDGELELACKYAIRIQELLVYVQNACPNAITPSTKKVVVTPMNNIKKVRFAEPITSSSNIKQVESSKSSNSNTPALFSTGVKCSTNDVKHSLSNANSKILYVTCNKSIFDGVHVKCLFDLVQNGNNHTKSAKKHKTQNIWKPTGYVFTEVGFKWKPTGRTFTIVGNSCPLTRFTSTNLVPPKQTTSHSDEIQKPEIKVYSRKPKNVQNIGSSIIAKIVESKTANHSEPNLTWGSNAIDIPSSSSLVMTGCPYCTLVSGLRMFKTNDRESLSAHELCVDLLSGSHDTNLYTISLDDMLKSSPICLLSKASKTKSWLWHRRLSHLNFGLVSNPVSQQPCIPPNRDDWDHLFQPMFDEYFKPSTIIVSPVQEAAAPRAEVLADSYVSTLIDQDAPSTSIPSSQEQEQEHSPTIS